MERRRAVLVFVIGVIISLVYFYKLTPMEKKLDFSSFEDLAVEPIRSRDEANQAQDTPVREISPSYPEDMTSNLTFDPIILNGPEKDSALETLMDHRISHLHEQCQATGGHMVRQDGRWKQAIMLQAPGFFEVCAIPKGGRTSWKSLIQRIPKGVVGRKPPLRILNVRNPLARLGSAYRDKYLGGLPLYKFDEEWQAKAGVSVPWNRYWRNYWYSALVFRGSIPTNPIPKREIGRVKFDYGGSIYNFVRRFSLGPDTNYRNLYRNTSFSFEEFLRYVVWTVDIGYMNKHWAPVAVSCSPCNFRYDFIVHLETIAPEFNYIMKFLNHTEGIQIEATHKTKRVKLSDIHLYENIPYDLLKRVLEIYKYDFELYGYRYPFE